MCAMGAGDLPGRGIAWSRAADGLAVLLGLASFIAALGLAMLIPFGIYLHLTEDRDRLQTLLYRISSSDQVAALSGYLASAAFPGLMGLVLALRRGRRAGRVSLAASAIRFSAWGLGLVGLIAALLLGLVGYRWTMWG